MPQFMLRANGLQDVVLDTPIELADAEDAERAAIQMLMELRINTRTLLAQGVTHVAVRDADEKLVMDVVLAVVRPGPQA